MHAGCVVAEREGGEREKVERREWDKREGSGERW